jgi:hypothetical protein
MFSPCWLALVCRVLHVGPSRRQCGSWAMLVLVCLCAPTASAQSDTDEATVRFGAATATRTTTRARLGVLGDAFTCPQARLVAYRRSTAEPEIVDQWYVASQQWADATLLLAINRATRDAPDGLVSTPPGWDELEDRCYLDKGFTFLDRLWDYTNAGYFPRSNPVGTRVDPGPRFGDDNALGGLALLAASALATDAASGQRYLHAAEREADFLRQSGLWDETFGGGFWWNTGRGDSAEGKPAQTNALAALLFARLYEATGRPEDREWAIRTLLWVDTVLYDPVQHLYRWSIAYADIPNRGGAQTSRRTFNYDQGLGIQAELAMYSLDRDPGHLQRARDVGETIMPTFWSSELGSLNLEAGVQQVYTGFSAWTSLGHLALYDLDGDAHWLDLARMNADGLSRTLRAPDGGYGRRVYVCVDRLAPGCERGQVGTVADQTLDGAALAWAQHLETAIAQRLAPTARP